LAEIAAVTRAPHRPKPIVVAGDSSQVLLRRVLRVTCTQRSIARLQLVSDDRRAVSLVDTGATGITVLPSDRDTALHVIWARDETDADIEADGHRRAPVAPGDTVTVAAGTSWAYAPGLIVCEIAGKATHGGHPGAMIGPTHGLESFFGYNRQTLCAITPGFSLERWKITQPLRLERLAEDIALVNLVEPTALLWPGGTDLLGRGEIRIIPPGTERVTLLPDGLGYVLIIRSQPDRDALAHGHAAEEIASITLG
jgi:hypothetical protein